MSRGEREGVRSTGRARGAGRLGLAVAVALLATLLMSVGALADGWPPGQSSGDGGHSHSHAFVQR